MRIVRSAVMMLVATGFAATAQAATRSDSALVNSVAENDLRDLVLAHGDTVDAMHPFDDPSVRGKTADGLKYLLIGVDCPDNGQTGCKSVMMQIRYTADDEVTLKGINDAAYGEAAVSPWWNQEGGTLGFTRFVYLEGGVTWGNLKQNLNLLFDAHWSSQDFIWVPKK